LRLRHAADSKDTQHERRCKNLAVRLLHQRHAPKPMEPPSTDRTHPASKDLHATTCLSMHQMQQPGAW
jgi:hypothetical protein